MGLPLPSDYPEIFDLITAQLQRWNRPAQSPGRLSPNIDPELHLGVRSFHQPGAALLQQALVRAARHRVERMLIKALQPPPA